MRGGGAATGRPRSGGSGQRGRVGDAACMHVLSMPAEACLRHACICTMGVL